MTQVANAYIYDRADIARYHIGSMLSGGGSGPNSREGGSAADWADMVDGYQAAALKSDLKIPILYGIDAVHGHGNVYGATVFPHNIGVGAAADPELARAMADATRKEVRATGIHWTFAPCVAVARDARWGRTYESFSENATLVAALGAAAVQGFQGGADGLSGASAVLATAKHYLADGGARFGTGDGFPDFNYKIDQGDLRASVAEVRRVHLPPYEAAVRQAGVASVMVSFSSINGAKMHGARFWVTDVLKRELKFGGIVVSDWAGIDQVDTKSYANSVRRAINAGVDMVMVPQRYQLFIETLAREVRAGRVTAKRIDNAVTAILRVKKALDLWNRPYADRSLLPSVGSAPHRALARQAVARSAVLLKNASPAFPLPRTGRYTIAVAGKSADNMGFQCGGWTIAWQGKSGPITPGTTILEGIRSRASRAGAAVTFDAQGGAGAGADYGIVVIGETPATEGQNDSDSIALAGEDVAVIERLCPKVKKACIVVLITSRPVMIADHVGKAGVWVAAWLPGTEGAGVADVLFGDQPFTGKLPMSWARTVAQEPLNYDDTRAAAKVPLFPLGHGLSS